MKRISPEEFTETLKQTLGGQLRAVVLYGSAAAGDYLQKGSDYNLLVVCEQLGLDVLEPLAEPTKQWIKAGNRPPLLFTQARLAQSGDVFPIELLDMRESHRVLFGDDPLVALEISPEHLRHQLEYELRSKLIKLRESYLIADCDDRRIQELLVASLAPMQVLLRAALRLDESGKQTARTKREAMELLAKRVSFEIEPFLEVERLKAGELTPREVNAKDLFAGYLSQIERVVDAIDNLNI